MRYVKFVNYVTISLSDEQMNKIKVVDIDELCNFYVHDFFIWNYLVPQNFVRSLSILKFKIQTVQTKSYEKMTKIKVVDLDALYNFVSYIFSHWNHLVLQKSIWIPNTTNTVTNIADPPRQDQKLGSTGSATDIVDPPHQTKIW